MVGDLVSNTDDGVRVCEFRDGMSMEACFDLLRASLNDHHLVFHPYQGAGVVVDQLLRENSPGRDTLSRDFHRLIVLDVRQAFDAGGLFDLAGFYLYALRQMCRAFGIPQPDAYHEEDLFQILRDEPKSLLCLVNIHLLSSGDRRRLRSLTQDKHQALIVYQRCARRSSSAERRWEWFRSTRSTSEPGFRLRTSTFWPSSRYKLRLP